MQVRVLETFLWVARLKSFRLAAERLAHFGAPWLRLRATKPGANPAARAVGVEIERSRP